jgi:hypothetical protein
MIYSRIYVYIYILVIYSIIITLRDMFPCNFSPPNGPLSASAEISEEIVLDQNTTVPGYAVARPMV